MIYEFNIFVYYANYIPQIKWLFVLIFIFHDMYADQENQESTTSLVLSEIETLI